jgi:hypothetical protein
MSPNCSHEHQVPLVVAAECGQAGTLQILIDAKADINAETQARNSSESMIYHLPASMV